MTQEQNLRLEAYLNNRQYYAIVGSHDSGWKVLVLPYVRGIRHPHATIIEALKAAWEQK